MTYHSMSTGLIGTTKKDFQFFAEKIYQRYRISSFLSKYLKPHYANAELQTLLEILFPKGENNFKERKHKTTAMMVETRILHVDDVENFFR